MYVCMHIHKYGCACTHATECMWKLEANFGCWSMPFTLSEAGSLFAMAFTALGALWTSRVSSVSTSLSDSCFGPCCIWILGIQTLSLMEALHELSTLWAISSVSKAVLLSHSCFNIKTLGMACSRSLSISIYFLPYPHRGLSIHVLQGTASQTVWEESSSKGKHWLHAKMAPTEVGIARVCFLITQTAFLPCSCMSVYACVCVCSRALVYRFTQMCVSVHMEARGQIQVFFRALSTLIFETVSLIDIRAC